MASWYANLGAVVMARAELSSFPSDQLDSDLRGDSLTKAMGLFDRAIQISRNNSTARYRLGLISLSHFDFSNAVQNFEIAYCENPENRGIRKNLGYSYIWVDDFSKAIALLDAVPEASSELDTYSFWWGTQGRDDLATYASQAATLLRTGY